jgi:type II secretory pathway pseudopilin PulG
MGKKSKVSAFTLVELLIVMILSLLVVGVVLLGYRHLQQYRAIQERDSNRLKNILKVQTALHSWFHKATNINKKEDELLFSDSICFASCVLKNQVLVLNNRNMQDTVHLRVNDVQIVTEGKSTMIKELSFRVGDNALDQVLQFRKEYGKIVLFNWEESKNGN